MKTDTNDTHMKEIFKNTVAYPIWGRGRHQGHPREHIAILKKYFSIFFLEWGE
jgi:hypothetical protein